jgi:hypothetical protein
LRALAPGVFDGNREASEALRRVDGQIGLQSARSSIGERTRPSAGPGSSQFTITAPGFRALRGPRSGWRELVLTTQ